MVKVALLFLVGMAVLALFGRLRLPRASARCRNCGRPRIGAGPCPCGTDGNG